MPTTMKWMRFSGLMLGLVVWGSLARPTLAGTQEAASNGVATLVVKIGQVEIKSSQAQAWNKAIKGMILFPGDQIKTRELSRAALLLEDGSLIRLNENTTLQLEAKKAEKRRLKLLLGNLWARVVRQKDSLEIETPSAVAAIKGTELEIQVADNQLATLIVWDGLVEFLNALGRVQVSAAHQSQAQAGQAPGQPVQIDLNQLSQWFESVVEVPATRTLKVSLTDKNGQVQNLNLQYQKR